MCRVAVELGIAEIAFSDHLDNNPDDDCYGLFDAAKFCREVDECRERFEGRLVIVKGAELGEPHLYPREIERIIGGEQFDFLTGGIHWVGDAVVSVDCQTGQMSRTRQTALYRDYFDEVLRAVECANFQVLAHLDLVKRFGVKRLGPFTIGPYRDRIEAILRAMIAGGIALEVNTSGLRQPCRETFPGMETLRLYRDLGGELITIGSDAHLPEHLGFGLADGLRTIREAGFDSITTYRDGTLSQKPLVCFLPGP